MTVARRAFLGALAAVIAAVPLGGAQARPRKRATVPPAPSLQLTRG